MKADDKNVARFISSAALVIGKHLSTVSFADASHSIAMLSIGDEINILRKRLIDAGVKTEVMGIRALPATIGMTIDLLIPALRKQGWRYPAAAFYTAAKAAAVFYPEERKVIRQFGVTWKDVTALSIGAKVTPARRRSILKAIEDGKRCPPFGLYDEIYGGKPHKRNPVDPGTAPKLERPHVVGQMTFPTTPDALRDHLCALISQLKRNGQMELWGNALSEAWRATGFGVEQKGSGGVRWTST